MDKIYVTRSADQQMLAVLTDYLKDCRINEEVYIEQKDYVKAGIYGGKAEVIEQILRTCERKGILTIEKVEPEYITMEDLCEEA